MKVIAAFLLAKLAGNENPTSDDLKKIFESVGAEIDETKIDLLFSLIKDHDVTELIAVGREKMAALSSGGPAVAMVAAGGGGGATTANEPVAETKKKVEEVKEESSDGDGMMGLFD
ncbi:Large ribosomal subunit protein P2x [Cardamine amara subsp. amara]|uniref:Large ribosomal subunit protein P2x n=1 Tax=Cardamine amara subsp. amara TaxID=228776 RepID=A0ABD1C1E3_CARAN